MLPKRFMDWGYRQRGELVSRQLAGEDMDRRDVFLGFTRHTPAVITDGPAGLNGSIKGVGFVPKKEHLQPILKRYLEHIESPADEGYSRRGLELLKEIIWGPESEEMLDFGILGTLELAKSHSWDNLRNNGEATLLFYQPPVISFELR